MAATLLVLWGYELDRGRHRTIMAALQKHKRLQGTAGPLVTLQVSLTVPIDTCPSRVS